LAIAVLFLLASPGAEARTFARPAHLPAGGAQGSVAEADINGDGDLDLVVPNYDTNSVSILLGTAGTGFGPPTSFPTGDYPVAVAVGDFNQDSDLDLAVADNGQPHRDASVAVLLGSTGVSFTGPDLYPLSPDALPRQIAVGDFNQDSDPDIAVANTNSSADSILLGTAGGSFSGPSDFDGGGGSYSMVVGDFNADSDPDLALASNGSGSSLSVVLGSVGATFTPPVHYPVSGLGLTSGDFDGDGDPDLAVSGGANPARLAILVGGPGGTFSSPSVRSISSPGLMATADVNVDGDPDLIIVQSTGGISGLGSGSAAVMTGGAGATFGPEVRFDAAATGIGYPFSAVPGDFDRDGFADLAVGNLRTDSLTVLTNSASSLWIDDVSQSEGSSGQTAFTFTVWLGHPDQQVPDTDPISVSYMTQDGSATAAGSDYQAAAGTLTFAPGDLYKTVTVNVNGDTSFEAAETFRLSLTGPTPAGVMLGRAFGQGTILNDDQGYARPKGATPVYVPLVIAYNPCASSNGVHAAPLNYGSCYPPVPRSAYLTVGTPDANGEEANAIGSLRYAVVPGNPSTSADEADVALSFNMTDVRNQSDLVDYTGELWAATSVRLTDRTAAAPTIPLTVADFSFAFAVPCAATADAGRGSACSLTTTAEAVIPGSVPEQSRAIWQLGQVRVQDGGADGIGSTTDDNTTYLNQGLFVP
jgi:hypothetical protein